MAIDRAPRTATGEAAPKLDEPRRRLYTVDEYYKMAEAGVFRPDERVQLIEGVILEMPPIGPEHADHVDTVSELFRDRVLGLARIRVQNPIQLADRGIPEPDISLVKRPERRGRTYRSRLPGTEDVLLVIEIADTSLRFDLGEKAASYARNGIPELWVVDVNGGHVIVHLDPTPDGYATVRAASRGEALVASAFPGVQFTVDEILE